MKKMIVVLTVLILSIGFFWCSSPTDPGNGDGVTIDSQFHGTYKSTDSLGFSVNDDNYVTDEDFYITLEINSTTVRWQASSAIETLSPWHEYKDFLTLDIGVDYLYNNGPHSVILNSTPGAYTGDINFGVTTSNSPIYWIVSGGFKKVE